MPKILQFRSGSVIYFKGDEADRIFILQTGQVNLVYPSIETDEDIHEFVQAGEFFGVKSTLGRYPREENAIATQDITVAALTTAEFESLIEANASVIMQMLKTFSNQLRNTYQQLSNLVEKQKPTDPESGLFTIGEYFLKNKAYSKARYVFGRYLSYYPRGKKMDEAKKNLEIAELYTGTTSAKQYPAAPNDPPQLAAEPAPVLPEPKEEPPQVLNAAETYDNAVNYIRQEKYQQAYMDFNKILQAADVDPNYTVKSSYELGHCLYLLAKYSECIKYYSVMLTKYPKHPNLANILFFMGKSWENLGKKEQAVLYYKKAASILGKNGDTGQEKTGQPLDALEV